VCVCVTTHHDALIRRAGPCRVSVGGTHGRRLRNHTLHVPQGNTRPTLPSSSHHHAHGPLALPRHHAHPLHPTHAQPLNRPKQKKVVSLLPIYVTVTVLLACSSPSRLLPHTSQPSPTCTAPAPRVYGSFVPICCCGPPLGSLNVCTLLEMRRDSAIVRTRAR
jgi:hypothetical protein